jgi:hypothetical protein
MKWIRGYQLFKESKTYANKNIISEICISMVLLNNEFLDSILDRGLKARYSENSQIFLTDLKNLLLAKNRLELGKFVDGKCVTDDEVSKINGGFDEIDFDIEKDWNILLNARLAARSIIDKLLPDQKLESEMISKVYWLGPNKDNENKEDIVLELKDGKQFSFYINKSLSSQKSSSFNTFAEDLLGSNLEKLYSEEYLPKWDKLVQQWIKIIYENSNKNIQRHIENFIDPNRIDTMKYFEYFDIRHSDPKFKHLGEFIDEFSKNILKFDELLNEVWKNKERCFVDVDRVEKDWNETKIVILNSKILENLFTNSLKTQFPEDIKKVDDNFKEAAGTVKMKFIKTVVDKMGCLERPIYYVGTGGKDFNLLPSREFFRENYDNLQLLFDYHVNFEISQLDNDFKIKLILNFENEKLIEMDIIIKFSGSELSGKLSSKYRYEIPANFNYLVSKNILD